MDATTHVPRCVQRKGYRCNDCVECLSAHPVGKTCGDCRHVTRCLTIFGLASREQTFCDFHPARFTPATTEASR